MVAGEDGYHDPIEPRNFAALPVREPYCQLFKAAETSRRLCQLLLAHGRRFGRPPIAAGQVATEGADIV